MINIGPSQGIMRNVPGLVMSILAGWSFTVSGVYLIIRPDNEKNFSRVKFYPPSVSIGPFIRIVYTYICTYTRMCERVSKQLLISKQQRKESRSGKNK